MIVENRNKYKNWLVVFLFFLVVLFFFHRLFFPNLQTFATPDFGQSDVFQLNVPLKFFLAQNLKNNQLPLWNPQIATGFPALAEGQTGTFYLFNLLLFKFLPFEIAFNLGIMTIFLTSLFSAYLFFREMGINRLISAVGSIIFAFSGFFICHLTHFNLIQSASVFPLLLFLTLKLTKRKNRFFWGGLFSLVLAQQIFAGFPQITVITLISALFLAFWQRPGIKFFIVYGLLIFLGFLTASIQLVPQYEFLRISTRSSLDNNSSTFFSYPFKHLITFIDPYKLGDPRRGTYPPFDRFDGSIFWENTGYIGVTGLVIGFLGLWLKIPHKKFIISGLLLWFLLMTGKYSPLYFVFSFPPLSLFRVPSRFILPFVFWLTILFAQTMQYFFNKKNLRFLLIFLIFIELFDLWHFGYSYHALAKWQDYLSKPATATYLEKNKAGHLLTLETGYAWNEVFLKKGWLDGKPYLYFRNDLTPNINVLFGISHFGVYPIQLTKRKNYFDNIILSGISKEAENIFISSYSAQLLKTAGVAYLLTTDNLYLENKTQQPVFQTPKEESLPVYKIYKLEGAKEKVYFVNSYAKAETVEEITNMVIANPNLLEKSVILEKEIDLTAKSRESQPTIEIIVQTDRNLKFWLETQEKGVVVINQSYYPGWQAEIDGVKTEILAANLNYQGLVAPAGKNLINLVYLPKSLKIGAFLTFAGLIIIFLMVFAPLLKAFGKFPKILFSFLHF